MKHPIRWALLLLLFAAVCAGALGGWLVRDWHTPYQGYDGEVFVEVPRGMGAGRILEVLGERGIVRHPLSLKMAYTMKGSPRTIQAGLYRFDAPLTPLEVLDKLLKGKVVLDKVTIPEGLRIEEAAAVLARAGKGEEQVYLGLFSDPGPVLDLDPDASSLEGYLLPDTYLVDPGVNEEEMVRILTGTFRKWWRGAYRDAGSPGLRETVTLASLVEKESSHDPERPLVAGVFRNRLRLGMLLQSDPTVIYAQVIDGTYRGRLLIEDLQYESPYNTYRYPGLPPGPICSPGRASLEAALHPAETDYLYFVSQNDGTHAFAKNLSEHNRNVARYRRLVRNQGRRNG